MNNLTIPYYLAAEWGRERFESVTAQIRETVEKETGDAWVWIHDPNPECYKLVRDMTGLIEHWLGWWWPCADNDARGVITNDCPHAIKALLPHVRGRDCIVQAGACVGTYPIALTDHFQKVVTFEPDPLNAECLIRNLMARDSLKRVTALVAALGETQGDTCDMRVVTPTNVGAHRVAFGAGAIPVWTIDALPLKACDAIWLDCEGSELLILKGAVETIERFSPTIAVEDKGLQAAFGIEPGALQSWLADRGYAEVDRIGNDKVFRRAVNATAAAADILPDRIPRFPWG